jgi:hypothetical protein
MKRLSLVLALLALLLSPRLSAAQTPSGSIRGTVTDESGAPAAGATVTATNTETGLQRSAGTSASGLFNLGALPPGTYRLGAARLGQPAAAATVRLGVGQTLQQDFRLGAGALQLEGITIVSQRVVETTTPEVATNVTPEQIENLPLNSRNFLDLATLAPGVQRRGAGISAGGASVNNTNLFVDGASFKSDVLPGGIAGQDPSLSRNVRGVGQVSGNPFPQNAVAEFRVITQNYKAEYQKATGALITASTRSGTNELRGDAFVQGQYENFMARSYWDHRDNFPQPEYARTLFGASLGGAIVRDRTHFFLAYEGNFQDLETRVDFNPPANLPALPDSLLTGEGLFDIPLRSHLFFGRLDHQLAANQSLMLTVSARNDADDRDFGGGRTAEGRNRIDNDVNTAVLRHTWNGAPFINEAQLSVQRFRWGQTPAQFGAPQVEYPQYGITRGANRSYQDFTQDRVALRNDLTWTGGRHVVKGGVGVDFLRYDIDKRLDETPVFRFRTDTPCGLSCPFEATVQIGEPDLKTTNQQLGAYVQDDWQATSRLVLNLGLRWDFETDQLNNDFVTPAYAVDSVRAFLQRFASFDAEDYITDGDDRPRFYGAFQPRLGFSYDLSGDAGTVVFGGAGLFYDRNNYNAILDEKYKVQRLNYTFRFSPDGSAPGTIAWNPSYLSRQGLVGLVQSGTFNKPEAWLLENDTKPPRSVQGSLGVRHMFGDVQLSVTGSMTHNYNGLRWMWGHRDPATGNQQWGANGLGAILISTDDAETRYRAMLVSLNRPLRQDGRWGGGIHYTLSRTETNTFVEEDMFAFDYVSSEDFDWVPGRFDERHRVSANLVVRLPYRFLVSTVTTLGSGLPYTLSTNCDNPADKANDAFCATQPIGNGNQRDWDENPVGSSPRSERPEGHWFGPFGKWAYRNVDLRLEKDFGIRGNTLGVAFDVYNLFNYVNFNYDLFQYNIRWDGQGENPRERIPFGTYEPRRVQVGLKASF